MPAVSTTINVRPVPVLDVDTVLDRLPAEVRATVAWNKKSIDDGLARLRSEPLTDELVDQVADLVWPSVDRIGVAFWRTSTRNADELFAVVMQDVQGFEDRLRAFLAEDDSIDTLEWVVGMLRSFYRVVFTLIRPEHFAAMTDDVLGARVAEFVRGTVAFMAAVEVAKAGVDPARGRDLVDVAFLELRRFRNAVRRHGLWLPVLGQETLDDRRRGALRHAELLRAQLSADDWLVFEQGRMRNLR